MVEEGEVERLHRAVEADQQAAVAVADTPQLPAQAAAVAANTEAAADTNSNFMPARQRRPFRAAFFLPYG